jgi:hypothetical protein
MTHQIFITYNDDKTARVLIPENKVESFFESINEGKCYYDEEQHAGFWTSFDNVRHIIIQEFIPSPEGEEGGGEAKSEESGKEEKKCGEIAGVIDCEEENTGPNEKGFE